MTKRTSKAAEAAGTVVYCGPSIKGVARQFTAYNNGIPEGLKAGDREKQGPGRHGRARRTCRRPCAVAPEIRPHLYPV